MSFILSHLSSPRAATRIVATFAVGAMALDLVDGIDLTQFRFAGIAPPLSTALPGSLMIALAACVLFNIQRKAAGVLLSLILFTAAYRTMLTTQDIVGFWRDLALIVALVWAARDDSVLEHEAPVGEGDLTLEHSPRPATRPTLMPPRASLTRFREDLNFAELN